MATIKVRMPIEVDITCVNKSWFTYRKQKKIEQYVIAFSQREGDSIVLTLPDNSVDTIKQFVFDNVAKGALLYAERGILSHEVKKLYEVCELDEGRHVMGDIHINNVKAIWKDLKRMIKQTHVHVSEKHLQSYCNDVMWRANTRDMAPSDKFELLINLAANTSSTKYKDLIK